MTWMGADKTKQLNMDEQDIQDEEQDAVVWPLSCPSCSSMFEFFRSLPIRPNPCNPWFRLWSRPEVAPGDPR